MVWYCCYLPSSRVSPSPPPSVFDVSKIPLPGRYPATFVLALQPGTPVLFNHEKVRVVMGGAGGCGLPGQNMCRLPARGGGSPSCSDCWDSWGPSLPLCTGGGSFLYCWPAGPSSPAARLPPVLPGPPVLFKLPPAMHVTQICGNHTCPIYNEPMSATSARMVSSLPVTGPLRSDILPRLPFPSAAGHLWS